MQGTVLGGSIFATMSLPGVNGSVSKELCTVDDLLRDRAKSKDPPPFLAYPRATQVSDDYEILSTADVDRLVDGAAKFLVEHGFSPVVCRRSN